jgi:outer membrane receptor protein involved in Fe transport
MKNLTLLLVFVFLISALDAGYRKPTVHSTIMLDTNFYSGENSNDGTYDNSDRFQIRKAVLSVEGLVGERMNYAMELGLSTCVGSGNQLKLMEAELNYELSEGLYIGLQQGHILSGFVATTGCSSRLSMEKPEFAKTFGSCHPLGFVINKYLDIGSDMDLETELAILNGSGGTLDGEHELNLGMIFGTPFPGLSLSGVYNNTTRTYYDHNFDNYSETGYRVISGFEYLDKGLWLTGEYYFGEGFVRDDQEMEAWYLQAGYEIQTPFNVLNSVQPYLKYEYWNRDKRASNREEQVLVETGLNFKLSPYTMVRTAYRQIDVETISSDVKPSVFIVRLQTNF